MEELIKKVETFVTRTTNPEQYSFKVRQDAQMELISAFGGDDRAGVWIDAYARRFDEIVSDPALNLIERLGDKEAHDAAMEELKAKLYH